MKEQQLTLDLEVLDYVIEDRGDSEPWKHSRLRWLDSTIASDHEIVAPFTPLEVEGPTTRFLGRSVTLGELSLPSSVKSFFTPEMTHLSAEGIEILGGPIQFVVEGGGGALLLKSESKDPRVTLREAGAVRRLVDVVDDPLLGRRRVEIHGLSEARADSETTHGIMETGLISEVMSISRNNCSILVAHILRSEYGGRT